MSDMGFWIADFTDLKKDFADCVTGRWSLKASLSVNYQLSHMGF